MLTISVSVRLCLTPLCQHLVDLCAQLQHLRADDITCAAWLLQFLAKMLPANLNHNDKAAAMNMGYADDKKRYKDELAELPEHVREALLGQAADKKARKRRRKSKGKVITSAAAHHHLAARWHTCRSTLSDNQEAVILWRCAFGAGRADVMHLNAARRMLGIILLLFRARRNPAVASARRSLQGTRQPRRPRRSAKSR